MIQSGLFAPNTYVRPVWFFTAMDYFTAMPVARSHIYSDFWRFLWVVVSWTSPYGSKTESIPEPKVHSRNKSFLVKRNRNRNRFHMARLCWNRNRNQLQLFRAESESIPESIPLSHITNNDFHNKQPLIKLQTILHGHNLNNTESHHVAKHFQTFLTQAPHTRLTVWLTANLLPQSYQS